MILLGPFLTELDSRAAIKGSRDPLGTQPLWTRFGRYVVGNLTTVTNSVRDFTTMLLGYYFADQAAGELGPGSEVSVFLKWEQLAAYARFLVNGEGGFRGVERVQKWTGESKKLTISAEQECQILSNQKTYGLWGLYTMAGRSSGLIDVGQPRLTPRGREFVEHFYLPRLAPGAGKDARRIRELLKQKSAQLTANDPLLTTVAEILKFRILKEERAFYRLHLVEGGPEDSTSGRQRQLAELLAKTFADDDFMWTPQVVKALGKDARSEGPTGESLAAHLARIQVCESVLAPTSLLFSYLLGWDGERVATVVKTIRDRWGGGLPTVDAEAFAELRSDLGDHETAQRWIEIAATLAGGDYQRLCELLLQQNQAVMTSRGGGGAWLEQQNGRLKVRFHDELGQLPAVKELSTLWRSSYFLGSLRDIARTLQEKTGG